MCGDWEIQGVVHFNFMKVRSVVMGRVREMVMGRFEAWSTSTFDVRGVCI